MVYGINTLVSHVFDSGHPSCSFKVFFGSVAAVLTFPSVVDKKFIDLT